MKTFKEFTEALALNLIESRIKFGSVPPALGKDELYKGEKPKNHNYKAGDKVITVGSHEGESDTVITKATHQHAVVVARRSTNPDHVYVKRTGDKYPVAYHFGNVHAAGEGDDPYQSMKSPEEKSRDEYFKKKNAAKTENYVPPNFAVRPKIDYTSTTKSLKPMKTHESGCDYNVGHDCNCGLK